MPLPISEEKCAYFCIWPIIYYYKRALNSRHIWIKPWINRVNGVSFSSSLAMRSNFFNSLSYYYYDGFVILFIAFMHDGSTFHDVARNQRQFKRHLRMCNTILFTSTNYKSIAIRCIENIIQHACDICWFWSRIQSHQFEKLVRSTFIGKLV